MGPTEDTPMPAPSDTPAPEVPAAEVPVAESAKQNAPEILDQQPSATTDQTVKEQASPSLDPVFSTSVEIPARPEESPESSGGEWDLLTEKIRSWASADRIGSFWSEWRTPLRVIATILILIIVVRIYSGVIGIIDSIPLASGLLELAGLIWLINFSLNNLIKSSDRSQVTTMLQSRWRTITGR